ncbi:MAG TPA: AAA family ATPase [Polyangiaceae bacterium]|jgi:energy-coupling factor transporter ATP-binding protein EcfA2
MSAAPTVDFGRKRPASEVVPAARPVDEPPPSPTEGPLKGLGYLARVATVGYTALVAETSEPIRWIWAGLISEGNHVEIVGPSGDGKTTLATLLAPALANPGEAIALFDRTVTPIRADQFVVFLEEENGKHSFRRKMETGCTVLGLPVAETLERVIFVIRRNVRVGDAVWSDVVELGRRGGVGAVFIDSRARVLRNGESNREEDQAAVADALFALIEASRAPAFVISHKRKGSGNSIEDVSGSVQRGAGADVILSVEATKDAGGRVLSSKLVAIKIRDDVEDHPAPVVFTVTRDAAGVPALTCSSTIEDNRPIEERLLEVLEREGALTKSDLAKKLSRSKADLQPVIDTLFAAERLRGATVRKNNRDFPAIALRRQGSKNHRDDYREEGSA